MFAKEQTYKRFMRPLLFAFIYFLFVSLSANATKENVSDVAQTNGLQGLQKLIYLDSLALQSEIQAADISIAKELLHEAVVQHNDKYKANAYFVLAKHYYSPNPDSMRYFLRLAEPLLLMQKRYEELFRMKGWNIYTLVNQNKNAEILPAVNKMIAEARKTGFLEGIEMAKQGLASAYIHQGFTKEGINLYKEVLDIMEKRNAPISKRFFIIRLRLNTSDKDDTDHIECYKKLKSYIDYCEKRHITDVGNEVSLEDLYYTYYRSLALDYLQKKNFEMSYKNILLAEKHMPGKTSGTFILIVKLYYYMASKQYDKAHQILNFIKGKKIDQLYLYKLDILLAEAQLNNYSGDYKKACELYSQYITQHDSITSAKFYSDLAKLRNQHDLDNLALQNKQMELKSAKDHSHMLMLESGILFLVLICCAFGYISYARNKHSFQLKKAKEKAEESDRLKSAFLANMNHEIRTPLNAIVGFSQVLIDEDNRENRAQYAKIIQSNNELLQQLIYDVLDLSKIESNTMQFNYRNIDLNSLIDNIYHATNLRMHDGVRLEQHNDGNIVFYTDPNRLTQIITNLLNNAIKHTQQGFIRFGYINEQDKVRFYVEDSGEGIPTDKLNTIFDRFVQLKDMDQGVGLGLAICKGLVNQMGGAIAVTSIVGKGSVFTVILPTSNQTNHIETKEIKEIQ